MTRQRRQQVIDDIMNKVNMARNLGRTARGVANGISTAKDYLSTPSQLRGATMSNLMQPAQSALSAPTISNFAATPSLTSSTVGANALNPSTATALTSGLENAGLGTFGTTAASEAAGAGGTGLASLGNIGANIATTAGGEALAGAGAGAGSALGGSTAAGAAAGGAAASGAGAALSALGPIGAALGAGYLIYNLIDGEKKKKNFEAIDKAQKATQANEQIANNDTDQAMQNIEQAKNKRHELENAVTNQGVLGDLPQIADLVNDQRVQAPEQYVMPNNVTGGASEVLAQDQPIQTGGITQTDDNRKLKDHLLGFFGDMGNGFKENNTTTLKPSNFFDDTYTTQTVQQLPRDESIGAYADKLKSDGVKEDVINAFLNEGKNSGDKNIAQWVDSHRDLMDENGKWKPVNKVTEQKNKKGLAYRAGEALGTINRIASHPATQGLASTAFWLNDGQSLGYSLGKGLEYGANKARSDAYRRMVTGDNSASVFGGYSEKDLNALTNQEYKRIMAEIAQGRLGETTRHNKITEGQKDRQLDMNYELGKERNAIMLKNSNITAARLNEAIRHNKVSEYLSQQRINNSSNYDVKEFNSNLMKYATMLGDPNATSEQKIKARRGMIENYGKDFINLEKKLENGDL